MAAISEQFSVVRDNASAFFQRIADLSTAAPPPGPNAANGYFRDALVGDGELSRLLQRPDIVTDAEPLLLLNGFTSFGADLRNGFHPDNYSSGWFGNLTLFQETLRRYGAVMLSLLSDIFSALGSDSKERQDARAKVITDIQAVIDAVNSKGAVLGGTHANGWIQVGVREAGGRAVASFSDAAGRVTDPVGKQIAAVLLALAIKLSDTGDRNMNPWLDAPWQIDFQSKVQATAAALRTI